MQMKIITIAVAIIMLFSCALAEMPALEPEQALQRDGRLINEEDIYEGALPSAEHINLTTAVYDGDGNLIENYQREDPIFFGASDEFSVLEGITTFRGNNYRDQASWGTIGGEPSSFELKWVYDISGIDSWTGVGWTGQCSIVRWPAETVRIMNIYPEKKQKDGLTEVIYATLDGHIYFLDFEDGTPTRIPSTSARPSRAACPSIPGAIPCSIAVRASTR